MIQTDYGALPKRLCDNHCAGLIGAVFKILPMKEESSPTLKEYIGSLLRELIGMNDLVAKVRYDADFMTLLSCLEYLAKEEYTTDVCKQQVFRCINLVKKLDKLYISGGEKL